MKRIPEVDAMLREIDAECARLNLPMLSVIVRDDDTDRACAVFWESVEKYKLRRDGETDDQVDVRIAEAAYATEYPPQLQPSSRRPWGQRRHRRHRLRRRR